MLKRVAISVMTLFFFQFGCEKKITFEPIIYSKDACHYCKMIITDKRFGAEVVTQKGKVHKFDSIECMAHHVEGSKDNLGAAYVVDFSAPEKMVEFKSAYFMHDPNVRSPMGKGIFGSNSSESFQNKAGATGELLRWQDVLKLIGRVDLVPRF